MLWPVGGQTNERKQHTCIVIQAVDILGEAGHEQLQGRVEDALFGLALCGFWLVAPQNVTRSIVVILSGVEVGSVSATRARVCVLTFQTVGNIRQCETAGRQLVKHCRFIPSFSLF